ncbi:deoxyribodipyrimidine photo-lyase-like [Hydractinia symbiolongicarpus]|uniref:deoxyribodipyrimidine photo-lyase-like n=1 Tax=Hydractinia symbiolongicarpus TaxID=13093 RepID=UPI00254F5009|nr:deoxyribodipyrimidine photo-lyase-like [Hydractinia symbiolongicarpus]
MKKAKLGVQAGRCRLRSKTSCLGHGSCIVYLMRRDIRVQDNWSLLRCQEEPLPVRVAHVLEQPHQSFRLAWFYSRGLEEVQHDLKKCNINMDVLESSDTLRSYLQDVSAAGIVADLNSLREFDLDHVIDFCDEIAIPLWEVDSHNIVPVWVVSDKQEYSARTIRPKINNKLKEWLTEFPKVSSNQKALKPIYSEFNAVDFLDKKWGRSADPSVLFVPGSIAGRHALEKFLSVSDKFEKYRNDPTQDATSGLSPWLRHGHLSKQRVALEIKKSSGSNTSFLEELIVRGELAENYTFYNPNYDNLKGAPNFGLKTLTAHANDEREYVYSYDEFVNGKTHDNLWNAAQFQLVRQGKMHGFMRMYWAKKILEWSASPEEALMIAIKLNDTYAMDGRDPRGYVGIMWSITGLHDQGWRERSVFGKVRYMNYAGCKRKFDVDAYILKNAKIL